MNSNMMHMLPTVHIIKLRNSVSTNGSTVFEEQSRHVLRNNARWCLRRTTMVRITSDVNWTPGRANKVLGAGVQTSYVHSSINDILIDLSRGACAVKGNVQVAGHVRRVDHGAAFNA